MRRTTFVLTAVVMIFGLALRAAPALALPVTFSDGTFNSADWSVTVFTTGNGGTVSASQQLSGGNPGAYRRVTNAVSGAPSPAEFSAIWSFHARAGATYDPSVGGAIASIDYSEDALLISGFPGSAGQRTGPALRQNGKLYFGPGFITPDYAWVSKVATGLQEDDFILLQLTQAGAGDPTQHPDFSAAGGVIEFGLIRANSTCFGCGGYTIVGGVDNWSVTVYQFVPEPSTLLLLGSGLAGIGGVARRRPRRK